MDQKTTEILKKLYNAKPVLLRKISEIERSEQPVTEVFRTTFKRRCQLTKTFLLICKT